MATPNPGGIVRCDLSAVHYAARAAEARADADMALHSLTELRRHNPDRARLAAAREVWRAAETEHLAARVRLHETLDALAVDIHDGVLAGAVDELDDELDDDAAASA